MLDFDATSLSVSVGSASGSSNSLIAPDSGVIVAISGLTSGNIYLEDYSTGSWVSYPETTFTADTLQYVYVVPGAPIRFSWDTVVGTPELKCYKAGNDGFASAAFDIDVLQTEVDNIQSSQNSIYLHDAGNGNKTFAAGDSPFSTLLVYGNGTPPTVIEIDVDTTFALKLPSILYIINTCDCPVSLYFTSNPTAEVIVASGMKLQVICVPALTSFIGIENRVQVIDSGNTPVESTDTAETTLTTVSLPAYSFRNKKLRVVTSCLNTNNLNTIRTYYWKIGSNTVAQWIQSPSSAAAPSTNFVISDNAGSTRSVPIGAQIASFAANSWTSSNDTTTDLTLTLSVTQASNAASEKASVQFYSVELIP